MFVEVLVEIKARQIDKTFTYKVPKNLEKSIQVGKRVLVPFGKQKLEGFILKIEHNLDFDYEIKDILEVIDLEPVLNEELLEIGEYISKKTLCTLISAYQAMLPNALKAHNNFNVPKKYLTYLKLVDLDYIPKNDNQKEILELLKQDLVLKDKIKRISLSSMNTLLKNKVIEEVKEETYRLLNKKEKDALIPKLTIDQENVVKSILDSIDTFEPFLLHGVTGSGKTEVYMRVITEVLKKKKEVIVLVPEISLTPQIVDLFKNRFKGSIAILHSALSDGEKYDEWRKIERKEVSVVVGARSAIFAPFTNIGLIILDEEHSDTYKQDNNPHYNAVDIAIKRAKAYNCPLILGSATPLIESYTRAKKGIYKLLELKSRINKLLPEIKLVDMKDEIKKGNMILSQELTNNIKKCISKGEQVILFLNRRGYSTTITCSNCGNVLKCPNCDIALTYHKKSNKLNCHYCNYTTFKPKECPECKNNSLNDFGLGTEKLEEYIINNFEGAKVIRMDTDTTKRKGSHEKIINDFRNQKYNILIGTQMISKGLDFEKVTLVGVINGDATLNIPDYRSSERTFSLLNQVSGRAGRSKYPGRVIVQCFNKDHYSIYFASKNDYLSFYNEEMNIRKKLNYPPYCNLCLIKLSSTDLNILNFESNKIKEYLNKSNNSIQVLGPSLSTIPKIYNKYYMQILIKYKKQTDIYNHIKYILELSKRNNKLNVDVDFNPKKI